MKCKKYGRIIRFFMQKNYFCTKIKVGSINSDFVFLPISINFTSVAFCLIRSLFATFGYAELKVFGYIARYAPSKTDKNPIKSI